MRLEQSARDRESSVAVAVELQVEAHAQKLSIINKYLHAGSSREASSCSSVRTANGDFEPKKHVYKRMKQ